MKNYGGITMSVVKKINGSIADAREFENLKAENEKLKAQLNYVAVMTDVDLEDDTDEIGGEINE
jgi:hypothetical protein